MAILKRNWAFHLSLRRPVVPTGEDNMARSLSSSLSRSATTLGLVLALAGCSMGKIDFRQVNSGYDATQGQWVPYTKGMNADISGNPFAMPQKDFNKLVSEAIQAKGYVPTGTGPRIRLVFNNAAPDGNYICESSGDTGDAVGRPGDGRVKVSAAYCSGGAALTYATGSITDVTSPDDPRFKDYLRNLVVYLFPTPETPGVSNFCMGMGC
jgi:hypothetical protein